MKRIIKTKDYQGNDRRGFKLNDIITPTTIALIISATLSIGGYQIIVKATATETKENTTDIKIIDKDMIILKTQVPRMQEDIKEVKETQKEMQSDIKLVLREIYKINNK